MLSDGDSWFVQNCVTARKPGITTTALAEKVGADLGDVRQVLVDRCFEDEFGRWWPMMHIHQLSEWCMVQAAGPDSLSPPELDWRSWVKIDRIDWEGEVASVALGDHPAPLWEINPDAWSHLPASQLVIYRPHPLTIGGPW